MTEYTKILIDDLVELFNNSDGNKRILEFIVNQLRGTDAVVYGINRGDFYYTSANGKLDDDNLYDRHPRFGDPPFLYVPPLDFDNIDTLDCDIWYLATPTDY